MSAIAFRVGSLRRIIVLKAICNKSVTLLFALLICGFQPVSAQIAPTNTATVSGSVTDSAGRPLANAKVSLAGPKNVLTQTDVQGLFVFIGVPFGAYRLSAATANLGTASRGITVEGDMNVAIHYEPMSQNGLKVIANVSSNVNAQFNVQPASITQVDPIANALDGQTSWRKILEQIPGIAQAGLGSGNAPEAVLPDGPLMPMQISINGALPYETATLLDDMPLIESSLNATAGSGTDLGVYALNGFNSADVVRGPGANAPSIVDSIGGSFVLHAPGAVNQDRYVLSLSNDPYGGIVANALAAVRWKKLSTVVTYGVNDSPGPVNNGVVMARGLSPMTIDGESFSCTGSCASGNINAPGYADYISSIGAYGGLLACCVNTSTAWSQHSGSIALIYAPSPEISAELYYTGLNSQQGITYANTPFYFTPPPGYTGSIPAGQNIFSLNSTLLGGPFPSSQGSHLLEEKISVQLGRGILHLAALQNRAFGTYSTSIPSSASLHLFGGGALCSNTSLPCDGTNPTYTPTTFNGEMYNLTTGLPLSYSFSTSSSNRDFLLSYDTTLGENFHTGVSFVKSYYNIPIEFPYQCGSFTFNLISIPSAVSQTTNEMRFFVGGNPSEKTSLDLSMYFVNANYHVQDPNNMAYYTDARYSYAAPRLGFVWRPTVAVAVRAAAGGGFAEAPLYDLVGSNSGISIDCISAPTYYSQTLTNLNLRPETSFAFDVGTDIRLRKDTTLSFDIYRSNLYGQFYKSTSLTGTYTGAYGTLPLYTTQYGNLGESRYEGILLDLRHDALHGIYWALSGGLTRGYLVSVPAGFYNTAYCQNCANLYVVPGPNFNGEYTVGASIPYSQALGTIGYRWNTEKYLDLVGTYFGNNNTYLRPAFAEIDGHIGYPLTKNASVLVTFRNITGIYDGAEQLYSGANLSGAPTVSGPLYPLYGEMYGPRTIIVTTMIHM